MSTPLEQTLRNLRSAFAWKCADAADAALRFAHRLEPDIDTSADCRRSFDAGLAAGREEYAALARFARRSRLPLRATGPADADAGGSPGTSGSGEDRPRLSAV
jgi:hypothetical protein